MTEEPVPITGLNVEATFEVTKWDEHPFDADGGPGKLTTADVTKTYAGDIEGDSFTRWLMAYAADGSATFVGLERIKGSLGNRSGSLTVQHVGTFVDGAAKATLEVVPGTGTDELVDAAGDGDFLADPAGSVTLRLTFPA